MLYLDLLGLSKFWNKIKSLLNDKADKEITSEINNELARILTIKTI